MADISNKIIRGTFGRLWVDGVAMANVKSFECKATLNYETVQVNGELADQQRFTGYSVAGTVTLHKIDSKFVNLVRAQLSTGVTPAISIVASLADPDSAGAERVELYNVTLDEVALLSFENAKLGEESIGFKAGGYRMLETIL